MTKKAVNPDRITDVIVFGIGAAGSNTFLNLLYGYPVLNFKVVDFDTVQDRNVGPGTQPYSKTDLNKPKTQALQRIAMSLKRKRIEIVNAEIKTADDIKNLVDNPEGTIIIDAFDNASSRNTFLALSNNYNVIHIGFSAGLTGEVVWGEVFTEMEESEKDSEIDVCEMSMARPFISTLASIASIIVNRYIQEGVKINAYFDRFLNLKYWTC